MEFWQANYRSMSFGQLLKARLPIGLNSKERKERMAFIAAELQIKAPALTIGLDKSHEPE